MPRKRKQTARYGNQNLLDEMSDLGSSDSDEEFDENAAAGERLGLGRGRGRGGRMSGRGGRRGRRGRGDDENFEMDDAPEGLYTRSECFKVEKSLLVYGWGRWEDILMHGHFKRRLTVQDVETVTKALVSMNLANLSITYCIFVFVY